MLLSTEQTIDKIFNMGKKEMIQIKKENEVSEKDGKKPRKKKNKTYFTCERTCSSKNQPM